MIRLPMVLSATAALALAGITPVASAGPNQPSCQYTLSPPQVVPLGTGSAVTSTLSIGACNQSIAYLTVACVQLQGGDGPGQCAQQNGTLTAQVYFQPYRPGATYVATGRGCANTGNPPQPACNTVGPLTATL
jgi:hypothetical protein